jgi:hypothetical protein
MRHSRQLSLAATATSPFRYPDLRDWLHVGHLAWFILDVVDQLDLEPFLRSYRADGHGHSAYDPRRCSACCYTPSRSGCAPRGKLNGAAPRTSPSGAGRQQLA